MTCGEARERLLEADLSELRGEGDSELSRHVRTCARCRRVAQLILEQERALGRALAGQRPRVAVDDALRAAEGAARRRRRRVLVGAVPALAAASVVAMLLVRNGGPPLPPQPTRPASEAALLPPSVQAPAGQDVAIFQTDNPNIVVVWLF